MSDTKPGMNVLDVGCGSGRLLDHAGHSITRLNNFTLTDIDPKVFRTVTRRKYSEKINFVVADICSKKLDERLTLGYFDRILCLFTLYILSPEKQRLALTNIAKLLSRNGIIVLTIPTSRYRANSIIEDAQLQAHQMGEAPSRFSSAVLKIWLGKIERNIHSGIFSAFDQEQMSDSLTAVGLELRHLVETYGGNAVHLIIGRSRNH
ncbi:MAG: class I SAM-dependent methyltransferase [Deltaproteobacteria bacterium]|nr:class I SAM-dependent methyltransferase [Deltaproteobacteria bacterium]